MGDTGTSKRNVTRVVGALLGRNGKTLSLKDKTRARTLAGGQRDDKRGLIEREGDSRGSEAPDALGRLGS